MSRSIKVRHVARPPRPATEAAATILPAERPSAAARQRVTGTATALSWIPLEAISGLPRLPFDLRIIQYDVPPPDRLDGIECLLRLSRDGRFRFANQLVGWIEVDDGRIAGYGQQGEGIVSATQVDVGRTAIGFLPVPFPELRPPPVVTESSVTFFQTAGGRTGVPAPRLLRERPFLRVESPVAWTTVALTVHLDGRTEARLLGASSFPRHWLYDSEGRLQAKSGLVDFTGWYRTATTERSPWVGVNRTVPVANAESEAERRLSVKMVNGDHRWRRFAPGELLCREGDTAHDVYLLFDGVLTVSQGDVVVAELGPGAVVGEMAFVGDTTGRRRNATLRAATTVKVGVVPAQQLSPHELREVASTRIHR